jgi:pimeloyl-ACP methyl ester carboxylesterase
MIIFNVEKMMKPNIILTFVNSTLVIQEKQSTRHSTTWRWFITILWPASIALMLAGCATPISVDHVDIQTAHSINTASALSTDAPSEASSTVLRRHGLLDRFESEPAAVLAELHKNLKPTDNDDQLFALAELSLLHAQRTSNRAYFLASAVYAWSLLFPGNGTSMQLLPSDPRFRLTYDIYNQALAQGLAAPNDAEEDEVNLKAGTYKLPFGTLKISLDETGTFWGGYKLDRFISSSALEVDGLRNRYHNPGIGVPLAASLAKSQPPNKKVMGSDRLGSRTKVPVTALLRLENARNSLSKGKLNGRLEVYADDQYSTVTIDGQKQLLESDSTAALAYQLNDSPLYAMEITNFLNGGILLNHIAKDRAQDGIFTLQPYKAGKIPIVLVHGTASSPARWAELVNELNGDPKIRERYQVWVFIYDSGNPVPYSAGRLRKALTDTLHELDPEGKDLALQQMVVIGHSQGGLLTKMTVIDDGTKLWDYLSKKPFNQVRLDPETREILQQSLFFKPLPFVKRVVFISTPQRGAMLAAYQIITGLASRLVKLPMTVMTGLKNAAMATGDEKLAAVLNRPPTAIDNMNPENPGLKILASIPVTAVPAHSIIAVEGDGPKEEGDDGVVTYKSAHIDEAASELVVRWNHSCQGRPEVIEEIRRILFEHLTTLEKGHS